METSHEYGPSPSTNKDSSSSRLRVFSEKGVRCSDHSIALATVPSSLIEVLRINSAFPSAINKREHYVTAELPRQ